MDQQGIDTAVEKLAEQLANLRNDWTDNAYFSGNVSPLDSEFTFFSNSFHDESGFGTLYNSCDLAQKKDCDIGQYYYGRLTDTPNTWPMSNEVNDAADRRYSHDSGIATPFSDGLGQRRCSELIGEPFPMTKQDVQEWLQALEPPTPGPGYICRICHLSDHYVQNCPRAPPRSNMNTPYQGYNKCYGIFCCSRCTHQWDSFKSWAEMGQICRRCQNLVYPNKQFPLDKIPQSQLNKKTRRNRGSSKQLIF